MLNRIMFVPLLILAFGITTQSFADDMRDAFAKSYQYERSQSYADAIKVLLPLPEKNYLVSLRLGWLYYLSGNYANAKQYYQSAIQAAPKAVEPRLGYTLPLLAQERYEEVELVTRDILIKDPHNYTASVRLAFSLRMQLKFDQAYAVNGEMLELYPTDVTFLTEQLLASIGLKNNEVRKLCETILMLDPENLTAKKQLAALAPLPAGGGSPKTGS